MIFCLWPMTENTVSEKMAFVFSDADSTCIEHGFSFSLSGLVMTAFLSTCTAALNSNWERLNDLFWFPPCFVILIFHFTGRWQTGRNLCFLAFKFSQGWKDLYLTASFAPEAHRIAPSSHLSPTEVFGHRCGEDLSLSWQCDKTWEVYPIFPLGLRKQKVTSGIILK